MSIRTMLLRANHEIRIERPLNVRSASGGKAPGRSFLPVGTHKPVWVQPATITIINRYAAENTQVSHRIFMDTKPKDIDVDYRVVFRGRSMTVKGVINEDELDRLWYIDVLED